MALIDEIRERRGDPDDPFDQDAAKRDWERQSKRRARREGQGAKDIYDEGVRHGKKRAGGKGPRPAQRASSRRRAAPVRKAARQMAGPMRSQMASFTYTIGLVLAVIALYWLLENADALSGLVGGIAKGLDWFAAPDRTIPNTGKVTKPPGSDAQHPITSTG